MANNSSPGSYVTEYDRSQRVRAVSTSIGAIVGPSAEGPIMQTTLVTSEDDFISKFGKPNPKQSLMHYAALTFLQQSRRLYVTRVVNDNAALGELPLTAGAIYTVDDSAAQVPRPKLTVFDDGSSNAKGKYDPFGSFAFNPNDPAIANQMFMVCAIDPGEWNNRIYVQVRPNSKAGVVVPDDFFDDMDAFWVDVFLDYTSPRQHPTESFLVKRESSLDGYGNQLFIEDVINKKSDLIRVRNNEFAPMVKVLETASVFFDGATNGGRVTSGQVQRGWDLYHDTEHIDVNILIQGGAPIGMNNMQDIADIQRAIAGIARDRMDAIAVLDVPSSEQQVASAMAYRVDTLNLDSSYAAMYSPDLKILDKFNDRHIWLPPSGFAAAAMALTDNIKNVWYGPAGMIRGKLNVLESRHLYNQGMRDALNDAQINAVRYFPNGAGYKVWGSDTMQVMASALTNIGVRRLMNMIEKSIKIADIYSVFDPNDQILRSKLQMMVSRFLQPIMDAGGLYWFQVICDDSNNTPDTIATGALNLDAYFDPTITTKRIRLNANILATGSTYREFITARG